MTVIPDTHQEKTCIDDKFATSQRVRGTSVTQTAEANNIDMDSQSKGGPSFIRGGNDCHT